MSLITATDISYAYPAAVAPDALLLDESTNHLEIEVREALEKRLSTLPARS